MGECLPTDDLARGLRDFAPEVVVFAVGGVQANAAVHDRLPPFKKIVAVNISEEDTICVYESNVLGVSEIVRPEHEQLLSIVAPEVSEVVRFIQKHVKTTRNLRCH